MPDVTRPIRVLHLEDVPRDAEVIHHKLEAAGVRCDIVLAHSQDSFEAALARESFDIILADYNLPGYDGISALRRAQEQQRHIPVIIISGSLGEEEAVKCLHLGATDYLLKHRLERLGPAVQRAMQEAAEHRRRQKAEEQLRESEARFQQLAQHSQECFWFQALNPRRIRYVSPAGEKMWGRPVEKFYEDPDLWLKSIHPDDAARIREQWEAVLQNHTPSFEMEFRIVRPDGSVCWVLTRGTLIHDDLGAPTMASGVISDITERRTLEAQYRQAQKMESVGQLAGGIAHDFNNLLTIINGTAELGLAQLKEGDQLHEDLQEIWRAGERAAALTRQLLAFSRKQILQPEVMNLNTAVAEMERMLRRLIGEDIDFVVVPTPDLGSIKADLGQLEQVIANLAVNARDAMPQGGRLTIETRNVDIDKQYAHQHGVAVEPGPYVMLAVSDTGIGMDEATQARIFEPFFTTKGPGKGTGLGLSTVYGIVKQSDGFIRVDSEVGQGTSFKIYLPQVAAVARGKPHRPTVPAHGTETILLVEDMEGLRTLARRMLESAGYTVLPASSGEEALLLLERYKEPVHLIMTDLVMPGMSGQNLVKRLAPAAPGTKVLYMSGFTDDVILRHGILDEEIPFLGKPFTLGELIRKVREVLDSQS